MTDNQQELNAVLKQYGVQSLVVDTSIDGKNYPYSGRQMVVAHDRLCQHIELRAKTLDDFIATAQIP